MNDVDLAAAVCAGGMTFDAIAAADRARGRHAPLAQRAQEKLGLTDDQLAKIRSELASEKESIQDVLRRLHTARAELRNVIEQPGASEGSIRDASAKVAKVEADAAVLRARLHRSISPVLTEEQKGRLKEVRRHTGTLADRLIDRIGERLSR